jgi:hypothetical protein
VLQSPPESRDVTGNGCEMLGLMAAASVLLGAALVGSMDFSNTDDTVGDEDNTDDTLPEVDIPSDMGSLLDDDTTPAAEDGLLAETFGGDTAEEASDPSATDDDLETMPPESDQPDTGKDNESSDDTGGLGLNLPEQPTVASVTGSDASDVLTANANGGLLDAGDGDDRIIGGDGDDYILGGDGNDSLRGGEGSNVLSGGDGSDILIGVEADHSHAMNVDTFYEAGGSPSADIMDGGDGDDVLRMGMTDVGIGGDGADLFFVQGAAPGTPDADIPEILDFKAGEDALVISYPFTEDEIEASWPDTPEREMEISIESYEDGTGATVFVNGQAVAKVAGGQDMDPSEVRVVGDEIVGADRTDITATDDDSVWWTGADNDQSVVKLRGTGAALG